MPDTIAGVDLLGGIQAGDARVAVIGLGYVGLPLALRIAASGFETIGIDLSDKVVADISAGNSPILDVADTDIADQLKAGNFRCTSDTAVIGEADVIVICVPTPLKDELPDTSYIEAAGQIDCDNFATGPACHPGEHYLPRDD